MKKTTRVQTTHQMANNWANYVHMQKILEDTSSREEREEACLYLAGILLKKAYSQNQREDILELWASLEEALVDVEEN